MPLTADMSAIIEDFLGSTHVFALALIEVLEQRLLDEVASGQLTPAQVKLLKLVAQAELLTVSDAALFLGVSSAAASKAIDRMVRRGFLQRAERREDRRASELAITAAGKGMLTAFETARAHRLAEIFEQVEPGDLRRCSALLIDLANAIVGTSTNPEEICLQCGVYFKERCMLHDATPHTCHFRRRKARKHAPAQGDDTR